MKLYFATGNRHKLIEVVAILTAVESSIEIVGADAVGGMPEVEENAEDFAGNARLKARALKSMVPSGAYVLADDSGLCVDRLDGAPGVRSSRYAGAKATDDENTARLLEALRDVAPADRAAHFKCVMVLIAPDGSEHVFAGRCDGRINTGRSGVGGFGYDPVFQADGYTVSFAALTEEEKNRISHRSDALVRLADWVRRKQAPGKD